MTCAFFAVPERTYTPASVIVSVSPSESVSYVASVRSGVWVRSRSVKRSFVSVAPSGTTFAVVVTTDGSDADSEAAEPVESDFVLPQAARLSTSASESAAAPERCS